MLFDTKGYRLYLRPGHVDFRKGSHALALLVEQEMELSLLRVVHVPLLLQAP